MFNSLFFNFHYLSEKAVHVRQTINKNKYLCMYVVEQSHIPHIHISQQKHNCVYRPQQNHFLVCTPSGSIK